MTERAVIVLGMHRSGTSALAGTLEEAGLYLGHVVRVSPDNPKGWCENPLIFTMHDDILHQSGGSVLEPPAVCNWLYQHKLMRDTIIDSFRGHEVWGFKDPRTLFTLEGWLEALPHAELVGIFRHPGLSVASLTRRDGRQADVAPSMWLKYNERLLYWHKRRGFPLLSFDDLETTFEEQVKLLAQSMALPRSLQTISYFEARHRRTATPDGTSVPAELLDTYQQLTARHRQSISQLRSKAAQSIPSQHSFEPQTTGATFRRLCQQVASHMPGRPR